MTSQARGTDDVAGQMHRRCRTGGGGELSDDLVEDVTLEVGPVELCSDDTVRGTKRGIAAGWKIYNTTGVELEILQYTVRSAPLRFALLCFALLCFALLCLLGLRCLLGLLCVALLCVALLCVALLCFDLLCFAPRCSLCFASLRSPRSARSARVARVARSARFAPLRFGPLRFALRRCALQTYKTNCYTQSFEQLFVRLPVDTV